MYSAEQPFAKSQCQGTGPDATTPTLADFWPGRTPINSTAIETPLERLPSSLSLRSNSKSATMSDRLGR